MSYAQIEQRIAAERERRMQDAVDGVGTWHYWRARGDDGPPPEEHWCAYCAGWFGVPHDMLHEDGLCRNLGRPGQCACIDCWVGGERTERKPAHAKRTRAKR